VSKPTSTRSCAATSTRFAAPEVKDLRDRSTLFSRLRRDLGDPRRADRRRQPGAAPHRLRHDELLLGAAAIAGSWLPARRASAISLLEPLRGD
jgi:hypothetical protein